MKEILAELRLIRLALERLVQQLDKGSEQSARKTESDCIAWFLDHMQKAESIPSLCEVSRMAGISRRQLGRDRWSRFRNLYDRLESLERSLDKSRAVSAFEEDE